MLTNLLKWQEGWKIIKGPHIRNLGKERQENNPQLVKVNFIRSFIHSKADEMRHLLWMDESSGYSKYRS